jgi:hypothetical protein
MTLAILALVLGPSCVVFIVGCLLAFMRSWRPMVQRLVPVKERGRAI